MTIFQNEVGRMLHDWLKGDKAREAYLDHLRTERWSHEDFRAVTDFFSVPRVSDEVAEMAEVLLAYIIFLERKVDNREF